MRKLFGNSSRGASGGRYVAGKQAERRSAPVQPDVQRPEADDGRPRSRRRAFPHPVRRVPKRRGPAGRKSGTRT